MAKAKQNIELSKAGKIAKRLTELKKLTLPVNTRNILENYADVIEVEFPEKINIDAVCLYLKIPGKRAKVFMDSNVATIRKRFTEAHELGHILIPWHIGTIFDDINSFSDIYDIMDRETEANQFAAELLMPSEEILKLINSNADLSSVHVAVCELCKVSAQAAAIQLANLLQPRIVYACTSADGIVEFSGRTDGTTVPPPKKSNSLNENYYKFVDAYFSEQYKNKTLHWWIFPSEKKITAKDNRQWREVLNDIIKDLNVPEEEINHFKQSFNGIISMINSRMKRNNTRTVDAMVAEGKLRLTDPQELFGICDHPDLEQLLLKKAEDLINK